MNRSRRRPAQTPGDVFELWTKAAEFDPTLRLSSRHVAALAKRQVLCERFSHDGLFKRMAAGKIALFNGFQVLVKKNCVDPTRTLVNALRTGFPDSETVSVMTGRAGRRRNLPVSTLMNRWERRRALVSVSDLHIRGTQLESVIDTDVLSEFNILCKGSADIAWHEMMTMVISAAGHVTDSHSDDPDGSNHCFVGRKLWLVWDTFEGIAHGLQDVERDYVSDHARFDMATFLRLHSARWFVVSPSITLFLPGDLTRKVVTLEHYLGVGSFYVSIPNCVRTVSRWRIHGPLWSEEEREGNTPALVGEIAQTATRMIRRVRMLTPSAQRAWGMHFLKESVRLWRATVPTQTRARLLEEPAFRALVAEAQGQP